MKGLKITALVLLMLQGAGRVFGQQEAMYTQYMFNTLSINPAYAGSRNVLSATMLARRQWSGIEGAPSTTTFTMDAPIANKKVGLGLQLFKDKVGITSNTGVVATYAYRLRMSRGSLAFGIQGSFIQYRADLTNVKLDPYSATTDDPAFRNNGRVNYFDAGVGVYYTSDRFYVGLSSPQFFQNQAYGSSGTGAGLNYNHVFLMTGYVLPLGEDLKLKPSVLVKAVQGAPLEGDINANLWFKGMFSVGAQYRTNSDVSGMIELQATPLIRIGYAYDYSITELKTYNSGSHEIMLRYEFGDKRNKVVSPRYF